MSKKVEFIFESVCFLAIAILIVVAAGIALTKAVKAGESKKIETKFSGAHIYNEECKIVEFNYDGCQYINIEGSPSFAISHKGNCTNKIHIYK